MKLKRKTKNKMVNKNLKIYLADGKISEELTQKLKSIHIQVENTSDKADLYVYFQVDYSAVKAAYKDKKAVAMPKNDTYKNFDPISESGCTFQFDPKDEITLVDALIRARENKKFIYDWKNIIRAGKEV